MSLSSGSYRIYSQSHTVQLGSFLGVSNGLNPLYVYPQTTPGLPAFSLTSLSNGKYQIRLSGAPVHSSNGFLVADKAAGATATEWTLQSVPQHGPTSYLINFQQGSWWYSGYASPSNQTSLQQYIYSTPSIPPNFSPTNVFQLEKLD